MIIMFWFQEMCFLTSEQAKRSRLVKNRTRVLWVFLLEKTTTIFCELIRPVARGICLKPSVVMIKRFWGYCLKFKRYNYNRAMLYFCNAMREQILVTGFWLYGRFSIIVHLLNHFFHIVLCLQISFSGLCFDLGSSLRQIGALCCSQVWLQLTGPSCVHDTTGLSIKIGWRILLCQVSCSAIC